MPRKSREEWKVFKNVFDSATLSNLRKLQMKGHFDEIEGPIAVGKESNVFTCLKEGKRRILKIYRVSSCNFNKMYDYIKKDVRYVNLKRQRRQVIFSWVQREYRNIFAARKIGVNVPTPIALMENVLILSIIGDDEAAPQLKDAIPKNKRKFLKELVDNMRKLHKAGMVHGDLSAFNILNWNETPYLIDFSQSTLLKSSNSEDLVTRDVKNIARFFTRNGLNVKEETIMRSLTKKDK